MNILAATVMVYHSEGARWLNETAAGSLLLLSVILVVFIVVLVDLFRSFKK